MACWRTSRRKHALRVLQYVPCEYREVSAIRFLTKLWRPTGSTNVYPNCTELAYPILHDNSIAKVFIIQTTAPKLEQKKQLIRGRRSLKDDIIQTMSPTFNAVNCHVETILGFHHVRNQTRQNKVFES